VDGDISQEAKFVERESMMKSGAKGVERNAASHGWRRTKKRVIVRWGG
jgi:hypothetical protein